MMFKRLFSLITLKKRIIIPLFCLLILFFLEYLGIFAGMNHYFYDLSFRIRGPEKPLANIVIVAIDEQTLAKLGRWPLKRGYYASILGKMTAAQAVAFDVMMSEPSEDDAILAREMHRYAKVVLPAVIEEKMSIEYPSRTLPPVRTGHVHIERGIDGIVREVYHTLYFQGNFLPSFSSVLYEMAGKTLFPRVNPIPDRQDDATIIQSDLMRINYYGGPGTFTRISFGDVINGVYSPAYFQGKIVLVGMTAMGLVDSATTPYSGTRLGTPGVEIQATILNNLLMGDAINVIPLPMRWIISLLLGLFLYYHFFRTTEGRGALLLIAALLLYSIFSFLSFALWRIWCAPTGTYVTFLTLFALAYIFKLNDAAVSLGITYDAIRPHLRNAEAKEKSGLVKRGISGVLTPKGIQSQAFLLNDLTNQLIFEKELSDRILLSDIFGVAVFDPEGSLVIANRDVHHFSSANGISLDSRNHFMEGLAPHIMEKADGGVTFLQWLERASMTVYLMKPVKRYLKVNILRLPVGEKEYSLFILTDITKLKEVEILKSHIVLIVSHELKAPMTSIQGFSEILTENLEGPMHRFATIIHDESLRLAKFVDTFLDINRIEEGRQQINKVSVVLSDLLIETALIMAPLAEKKGIRLLVERPDNVAPVSVDRDLTKQCIMNLVENAMKYSPSDREVILKVEEAAEVIRVDVTDQGYGIRPADLDIIFEKFYRSRSEETEEIKGSGLGLTFVKKAVEAQGGRIAVVSTYGKGSTFSLFFPKTV